MIVKRYSGRTAEEALAQAKWELGDDAVILSSGLSRDRWWKFWQNGFQVLVATDYPVAKRSSEAAESAGAGAKSFADRVIPLVRAKPEPETLEAETSPVLDRIEIRHREPDPVTPPLESASGPGPLQPDRSATVRPESTETLRLRETDALIHALHQIDDRLGRLEGFVTNSQQKAYKLLTERGMDFAIARELAEELSARSSEKKWQEELTAVVRSRMPKSEPIHAAAGPMIVVLIGPTGSGKTTTIAKLAAHYHLQEKKSVLMVTTDTFRIGAVEQLETFAGILKIPFQVAHRPKEVKTLIEGSDAEVILIDTQGHSVRHSLHMAEIRSVWEGHQTAEVLLTVPATFTSDEVRRLGIGFLQGEPGKVVITKVDEAHRPGPVLSALMTMDLAVSFVTNGQSVPEDIHPATAESLMTWLMEGEYRG